MFGGGGRDHTDKNNGCGQGRRVRVVDSVWFEKERQIGMYTSSVQQTAVGNGVPGKAIQLEARLGMPPAGHGSGCRVSGR